MDDIIFDVITKHIFNGYDNWISEDTAFFSDVYGEDILPVVFAGGIDLYDKCVYYSPMNIEVIEFLNDHPHISCHGCVKVEEGTPIVTIEGLYSASFTETDREDFLRFAIFSDVIRDNLYPPILYNKW